jgi:triacylglycerol lipase
MKCNIKILISEIIILILILFILIKIKNKIKNEIPSLTNVLYNNLYCGINKGNCLISVNNNINVPNFTSTDIKNQMLFCIDMVSRIIHQYKPIRLSTKLILSPGLTLLKELIINSKEYPIFGYIAYDTNNNIYIAFRGTMDKDDMKTDLDYKQIDLSNNIKVHEGFYNKFNFFKNDILNVINNYNEIKNAFTGVTTPVSINNIIITGHSLGSAIATICAYEISKNNNNNNIYTYIFASPRVGNVEFSIDYNTKVPNTYRVVNISDIIPTLPPAVSPNFENPIKPYIYKHVGTIPNIKYFDNNWMSILDNHMIYNYRNYIENLS